MVRPLQKNFHPYQSVRHYEYMLGTFTRFNPYVNTTYMYAGDFHPTSIGIYIRHYMYTVHAIKNMTEIR